jgi:hypothetical protein
MCLAAIASFFVASAISSARDVERLSSARYIAALKAQHERSESARTLFRLSHEQ